MVNKDNKIYIYFFLILIGISLFGISVSLVKFDRLNFPLITGFQSFNASARVNVTIAPTVLIRFNATYAYVDFGNGSLVYAPNLTTINTSKASTNPSTFKDPGH